MFDIPQVGHLSSHIVWSTMAVDMDCGGSKVGGGAEMTCSVLVRPARSLAEDSGSGLACASMFGPRCARPSRIFKRGARLLAVPFDSGPRSRSARYHQQMMSLPALHSPCRRRVFFGSSTRERRDQRSQEAHLHLSVLDLL